MARKAVYSASGTTDVLAHDGRIILGGFNITEMGGTSAEVAIRDGSATGDVMLRIKLAAGEVAGEWFGPQGVMAASGLFVDRVSGTTEVILYAL